ncbi:hypothetical protein GCM10027436_30780 [Actinophytocola sediminis]
MLISPEPATDGISILWDFSRTEAGAELIDESIGQTTMREIMREYLTYVRLGADQHPNLPVNLSSTEPEPRSQM